MCLRTVFATSGVEQLHLYKFRERPLDAAILGGRRKEFIRKAPLRPANSLLAATTRYLALMAGQTIPRVPEGLLKRSFKWHCSARANPCPLCEVAVTSGGRATAIRRQSLIEFPDSDLNVPVCRKHNYGVPTPEHVLIPFCPPMMNYLYFYVVIITEYPS